MNKFFMKIATLSVGLAMAIGVGIAASSSNKAVPVSAEEALYKDITFDSTNNSASVGDYTSTWSNTTDDFTWTFVNFNNNQNGWSYVKCGRKNNASTASIKTQQVSVPITKVGLDIGALTASKITSITLYSGASAGAKTNNLGAFDKSTGEKTKTIASPAENLYYTIEVVCQSGSSNGLLQVNNVKLYYNADDPQTISGATAAFTDETVSLTSNAGSPTWSIVTASTTAAGAAVTSAGVVSVTGAGTVVVKASKSGYVDATHTIVFSVRPVVPYLTMDESTYNKYTGDEFNATFTYGNIANGNVGDISFTSDDASIADVTDEIDAADGIGSIAIECKKAGTATFTISYGGNDLDIFEVVIIDKTITITLNKTTAVLWSGDTLTLIPTITAVGYSENVSWSSNNTGIATVENGVVTPVSTGLVTITCASVDHPSTTATCNVTVKMLPTTYFDLDLSTNTTSDASETYLRWTTNFANVSADKVRDHQSPANNYYPGTAGKTYTSTRFYSFIDLTITPAVGFPLAIIDFTATSEAYATALANSTWTNATASASGTNVRVIVTDGSSNVLCTVGATCGFTNIRFYYVEKWAETFLSTFTCTGVIDGHPNGDISVANPTTVWATFKTAFGKLDSAKKASLKVMAADISGNEEAQALARYDLVIRKYGIGTYEDYIGRFSEGGANANARTNLGVSTTTNNSTALTIIAVSVVSLASIGGYFFLRRRKEF